MSKKTNQNKEVYIAARGFEATGYGEFEEGQIVPDELGKILYKRKSGEVSLKKEETGNNQTDVDSNDSTKRKGE